MTTPISQKDYLKKYLAIGKAPGEKKKKKKKPAAKLITRVTIIDDDADHAFPSYVVEDDPLIVNEDAPQIVAIIDERPPSLRVDEKTKNPLWRPVGSVDNSGGTEQRKNITGFKISSKSTDKTLTGSSNVLRQKKQSTTDRSPPRKQRNDDDNSPPRKTKRDDVNSPPRNSQRTDSDLHVKKPAGDNSPPRRIKVEVDSSPPRRRKADDISPPRRSRFDDSSSHSRHSRSMVQNHRSPERSKHSRHKERTDRRSPDRSQSRKRSRWNDDRKEKSSTNDKNGSTKLEKTLDGKMAGLQNAQQLAQETQEFRTREDQQFTNLPLEVSGKDAQTVHRDRKTGKIRNLEEEAEQQSQKLEAEQKAKEKYTRWGRGLAQVENREQQLKEELHEMSKPLARYADDEDLERYLKEQEREGDPMLAYIRSKRKKKAAERGEVTKPQFEGEFMPNRYGIRPGHRWDGVDRSNGYEKKWFEVQNAKTALQEDVYKWSTEDM